MRRIVLEGVKEKQPKPPRWRQRWCVHCNKWYRCASDKGAEAHKVSRAHIKNWEKAIYG